MKLDALYAILFSTRTGQPCIIPPQESRPDIRTLVIDGMVYLCINNHDKVPVTVKEAFEKVEISKDDINYCMNPTMPLLHELRHVFDSFTTQVIECIVKLHLNNQQKLLCMSRNGLVNWE